jgi:hypothetical protein
MPRVLLGDALAAQGRYEAASDELRAALATNPGLSLIVNRLEAIGAIQVRNSAPAGGARLRGIFPSA